MEWPKITDNYTAQNGYVIRPINSMEAALAHGRAMPNGLEMPGIYHEIAASGGNVIFEVVSPDGQNLYSGSLKSGNEGIAFVNFLRGRRNVEIPANSPAYQASTEWAEAINSRSIHLNAIPTSAGLFVKAQPDAPAPRVDDEPENQNFVSRAMSAFRNLLLHSHLHAPTPITPTAPAEPERESLEFTPRDVPEGSWSPLASPGAPNPETGLSVVPAIDAVMLRYTVEQCECRMMWEFENAREAVESGVCQIAAIMSNGPNNPVVGYAMLGVRNGQVTPTQITARFDHKPTADMIRTVTDWVNEVNTLQPEQTGPSGITRNIGINGSRFMVENYERGTEPHYNDFGQLVENNRDYSPGLAFSNIRNVSHGAVERPNLEEIPIRCTDMPTLTNLEAAIPGLRFHNISMEQSPLPIAVDDVIATRAIPFQVSSPSFGIVEGIAVDENQRRRDRNEEDRIILHQAGADGLNEQDVDGNGVPDADEETLPTHEHGHILTPPRIAGILCLATNGEISVDLHRDPGAVNEGVIRSLRTVIENVSALSRTLEPEMKMASKPVLKVVSEFYPELLPTQVAPAVTPAPAPTPQPRPNMGGPGF